MIHSKEQHTLQLNKEKQSQNLHDVVCVKTAIENGELTKRCSRVSSNLAEVPYRDSGLCQPVQGWGRRHVTSREVHQNVFVGEDGP